MNNILETLINASEKAACVARSCCAGPHNEELLVAEKLAEEANERFEHDFKTLADVVAQEAARCEIASCFPDLAKHVRGEECTEIDGVRISLQDSKEETAELLRQIVAPVVAARMAEAAHCSTLHGFSDKLPNNLSNIDTSDLGVWIDPIDATAEFIAGVRGEADADRGLLCVTVLIGAYSRSTGEPVIGVINQPFYDNGKGRVVWGVNYGDIHEWGGSNAVEQNHVMLMSGAEKPEIAAKFKNVGWEVKTVPGAGHKLLKVVLGEAAAYIVSQGTTYRWDTCAPHAILRAKGGDVLCYKPHTPVTYNVATGINPSYYRNSEGIIAFNNPSILEEIKNVLCE
ncbi:unnamed protein product [Arctia plantaginis]|uniref:Inositol polyphosphate 1-phosphatase n=1 Tax=Arctia plantaginis TaxID=874455 RepID=A0A8S0ZU88_ARCPL|nr:unnamed protein product [Arctia plantaginis]